MLKHELIDEVVQNFQRTIQEIQCIRVPLIVEVIIKELSDVKAGMFLHLNLRLIITNYVNKSQNYQSMQLASSIQGSQLYVPGNRMGHPERRKMYHLNDRHNLNSSVDLNWLNSLQMIDEKKHNGSDRIVEKYNQYVSRQLSNRYNVDRFATIVQNDTVEGSRVKLSESRGQMGSSQVQNVKYDQTLNHELQNFKGRSEQRKNSSHSVSNSVTLNPERDRKASFKQEGQSLSPRFLKQLVLRSALDPPQVYSQFNNPDFNPIRNFKPDTLQNYLRGERKRFYN